MIRRDIWGVKVYDMSVNDWCFERMFLSKEGAQKYRTGLMEAFKEHHLHRPKLSHPSQHVLDVWILCGNRIED